MWVCKLCGADFEPHRDRSIVCRSCHDRVRSFPSQALTAGERLWGKSYERQGCWEFSTPGADGRAGKVSHEKRQRPATQVALLLSGRPKPSEEHVARAVCLNKMCVHPEHLEWVQWLGGPGPAWSGGIEQSDLVGLLATQRAQRAMYQRKYRKKLRELGARSIRDVAERGRAAAARPADPAPASQPAAPAVPPVAAPSFLDALAGAKIAAT